VIDVRQLHSACNSNACKDSDVIDGDVIRLLSALDELGGFSKLIPRVDDLSPEAAFITADRAEQLGYISTPAVRNAANRLSIAYDINLTSRGREYLIEGLRGLSHAANSDNQSGDAASTLESRSIQRASFAKAVFDESDRSETHFVDGVRLGTSLGLTPRTTDDIMRYLEGENLIRFVAAQGLIAITHRGIVEIEQALLNPQKATEHFESGTIVIHGNISGSQVQIGVQSHQLISAEKIDHSLLETFVATMRAALITAPLPDEVDNDEAMQSIELIEVQLARPNSNNRVTMRLLSRLVDFAYAMAASGAWAGVVELAKQLSH
jgi:hypothetical protein